nr:serine/threonine-protein kinase [Nocardia concava]
MLNSGDVFAGFTVERLLGQGGMGSVYLARHPRLGKLTALKLLNRELYADREIRARFEREADLVARLDHPNIVEVYDRGTEDEMLWISMQYVDGVDAASVNVATLPPERAVQVIEGVASALDYAHGMGVLHRDVKPANIILARAVAGHGERVFLTDFGIARLREDSTHLTQAGMFTATLAYASPEQMTGAHLDPTTDQYSLACALYWLLIGAGPYDSPHPAELIRGHLQLLPPPVSLRRPGLSPAMDAVLTKAMAKRPADRFPSCTAFAKAARQALSGPPSPHPALQHPARPTYPNPAAPQPNYPAAQPYPAPGYQVPPQPYPAAPPAYPSPPQQPPAYPVPPQPSASPAQQPIPAPNYPAPQPQPGAPGPQQSATPGYQPPAPNPQQAQGAIAAYPAPPPPAGWPQDTERVNSGPTARPYPPAQEPAPANYGAPQQVAAPIPQQPMPDQAGSGPTNRPHPAPPSDDPSQRPTDIVPHPVVSTGRQADSAAPTETLAQPGCTSVIAAAVENSTSEAVDGDSASDSLALPGSPGFAELAAEPSTALASGASAIADADAAVGAPDSLGADDESGAAARHPDSGAFVPSGASGQAGDSAETADSAVVDVPESVSGAQVESAAASDPGGAPEPGGTPEPGGASEPAAAQVAGTVAAPPIPGSAGDTSYGGYSVGSGYGAQPGPFGPNVVRPGLIPTSQRAEASQVTALVVLGLAVVALVLMVVVAVVLVSG